MSFLSKNVLLPQSWLSSYAYGVQFRIATTVYRCLHGMAPENLSELCFPVKHETVKIDLYPLRSSQSN